MHPNENVDAGVQIRISETTAWLSHVCKIMSIA
jgi:hypothetical protein